jgi:hypothetical protein
MSKKKYTTKEKIKLAHKRGIYTEHELKKLIPEFLSNKEFDEINKEKQNKHIIGTFEFKQADTKSKQLGFAGSAYFTADFDIYSEIKNIRGTGLINFNIKGFPTGEIVKFYKKIGFGGKKMLIHTDIISIRYSKTKTHAFPVDPIVYEKEFSRKEKTCIELTIRHNSGVSRTGFVNNIYSFLKKVKSFMRKIVRHYTNNYPEKFTEGDC